MPDEEGAPATEAPTAPADETLREEGVKALESWKQRAKAAEADAKRAKQLETELQQLREQTLSESEKAIEAARKEGAQKAEAEWGAKLTAAQVELAVYRSVGSRFADPGDALRFLDLEEVVNNGAVDDKRLSKAVDELLTTKPYLAATANGAPSAPGGPRTPADTQGDMNQLIRQSAGR